MNLPDDKPCAECGGKLRDDQGIFFLRKQEDRRSIKFSPVCRKCHEAKK